MTVVRLCLNRAICFVIAALCLLSPVEGAPKAKPWTATWDKAQAAESVGEWALAAVDYQRALETARRSGADQDIITELTIKLATAYVYQSKFALAEPLYNELMRNDFIHSKSKSKEARESIVAFVDLADAYAARVNLPTREDCLKHALAIREKTFGKTDHELLGVLNDMFLFYNVHQRFVEAESILKQQLAILESEVAFQQRLSALDRGGLGGAKAELVRTLIELASVEFPLKRFGEVEAFCRQGYPLSVEAYGPYNLITAGFARGTAFGCLKQGKLQQAEEWAQKSVNLCRLGKGQNNIEFARDLYVLGRVYDEQGNSAKSEQLFQQSIAAIQRIMGRESVELIPPLASLAVLLKKMGKQQEAKGLERQVANLRSKFTSNTISIIAQDAI